MTAHPTNNHDGPQRDDSTAVQPLVEQMERQQALLQSLLGQIDILISAADEHELLDVVCTQLLASGLFVGAWIGQVASPRSNEFTVITAGSNGRAILDGLSQEQTLVLSDFLARAQFKDQVFVEESDLTALTEPWRPFAPDNAHLSIFFIPIFRNELPWAVLVVVHTHDKTLDRLVSDTLTRLGELIDTALGQLDLRKQLSEEYERTAYLAYHDALTSLANRRFLDEELPKAMARAQRHEQSLAIVMLDIDDFKPINDQYGHAVGDELLVNLANRLSKTLRSSDLAVRQGGDEFILLIEGIKSKNELIQGLNRIQTSLNKPYELPEGKTRVRFSMGVTVFPEDDVAPDILIRHADAALYASKDQKYKRQFPWQFWHELGSGDANTPVDSFDRIPAYGPEAAALIKKISAEVKQFTKGFVDRFYRELAAVDRDSAKIISWLSAEEYEHLRSRQTEHLEFLLSADLTEEAHCAKARAVGDIHAFIGVSASSLVRAITVYMHQFDDASLKFQLGRKDFNNLESIITSRLSTELSEELESEEQISAQFQEGLNAIDALSRTNTTWQNFNDQLLEILCGLPAIKAAWIGAPDDLGQFIINFAHYGEEIDKVLQAYPGRIELPSVLTQATGSQGSTGLAFRTSQVQRINNFSTSLNAEKWRKLAQHTGIRSSVSIPILDAQRNSIAVLTLYGAYPGMFEAPHRASFSHQLGFIVSQTWTQFDQDSGATISIHELNRWREALYGDGLHFVYQPIIDLRTGKLNKVESLARLDLPDGRTIMPGQFIPRLNERQIIYIFKKGLDSSLRQLSAWQESQQMKSLGLSLNLPLEALLNAHCVEWVRDALTRFNISARNLWLEVLEHAETKDHAHMIAQMQKLSALGVHLAMDDLGSGYSSLIRLNKMPFDTVKIDQTLLRSAYDDPPRIIKFISALIRMTQIIDLDVVVEGLEHPDLIETARILGADMGQGYGIGFPMTPTQLENWLKNHEVNQPKDYPTTPMGALATHLLYIENSAHECAPVLKGKDPTVCPVHRFIEEHGLIDGKIDHAHRAIHKTNQKDPRLYVKRVRKFQALLSPLIIEPAPKIDTGKSHGKDIHR
ncbi:MAG: hypothetical protein B7X44_07295 [Halothiobacillus sp. 15-55-196]|jgi:diguanylate cyclase (GGDEF)-like protein|uniref:EAL domain-containing protein n=1 Tax=Halothiobacillus sp. 15-55-196 TaxID=1970382 RepID=UPI000BCA2B32|nr:EAL domain-containing protein [Halothiobacillus sp. 15-55-196]OZB36122.1 MAG: hypothetical protein B7X44_07295 [Halothiobacillus sp. 15-55-196]